MLVLCYFVVFDTTKVQRIFNITTKKRKKILCYKTYDW